MLPLFQFALNNSASASTQLSPFQLMHGRDPIAPVNLMLGKSYDARGGMELGGSRKVVAWARDWWKARRKLCVFAENNLKMGARLMKRRYDSNRKAFVAEPGDLVLLSVKSHPSFGAVRKLRLRYTGPYVVKKRVHPNAYELDGLPPAVPVTQNVSFLRLFYPTPRKFETRPLPAQAAPGIKFQDHREWEVESIVADREVSGQRQYQLKWKDHEELTWVRVSQLQHCAEMLREYQHERGLSLDYWTESSSSPESQSETSDEDDEEKEAVDDDDEQEGVYQPEVVTGTSEAESSSSVPNALTQETSTCEDAAPEDAISESVTSEPMSSEATSPTNPSAVVAPTPTTEPVVPQDPSPTPLRRSPRKLTPSAAT